MEPKNLTQKELFAIKPGDKIRIYQIVSDLTKNNEEKIQIFEGVVIAKKHGKEMGATITVRKEVSGIGVEKIFPINSPLIKKVEILKIGRVKRAKLYYLRKAKGKKAKIKTDQPK